MTEDRFVYIEQSTKPLTKHRPNLRISYIRTIERVEQTAHHPHRIIPNQMSSFKGNQVKNRAPAPIQISAEQIIREARDRQEPLILDPIVKIHDAEEYQSFLASRRKHFEDNIRFRREHIGNWVKYARFEEENKEFERARSVFERALEVDPRSGELWLRYAEFEMRNQFVNRARNILDRAVSILPRVDFLWYKYAYMEEMVGDVEKCKEVFERWMEWVPDEGAWVSYARFLTRAGKTMVAEDNGDAVSLLAAHVMKRYVNAYPCAKSFLRMAKWAEYEAKDTKLTRQVFESALTELEPEEARQAKIFRLFAAFEERQGEYERARLIFRHALQLLNITDDAVLDMDKNLNLGRAQDKDTEVDMKQRAELYRVYVAFEKKHGNRAEIEHVVISKQRSEYSKRCAHNPLDYDLWFEFAKLEEDNGDCATVRDVYERAIVNIPPVPEKSAWKRYIYLWIYYSVYEEMKNQDLGRSAAIYQRCLDVIPHTKFSFSKIWIYAAKLHIRRKDLASFRKLMGKAIGMCGKEKIFQEYISLEMSLGEIDRCRALFSNYLKSMPNNCRAWGKFADLERSVGETERCRAIYELAITQPTLDMPELIWKSYIDFETEEGESDKARALHERLIDRTGHVKVWIAYAQFEASSIGRGMEATREIFERGYTYLKNDGLKEERILLLDAWRLLEKANGDHTSVAAVEAKMPRRIKRKRLRKDDQSGEGWEEYFDYCFPDEQGATGSNLKILEMAAKWKQQHSEKANEDSDDDE